jgi:hypothetical protein
MHGNPTPRELQSMLFQGAPVPRPLLLPIAFSLGARIENVSLRAFLGNPTKITNAMRQLRGPLGADGITCYCDPFLEAEALGATLQWSDADGPPQLVWPGHSRPGEVPSGLLSPEEAVKRGRIPIAIEVIRRLKALLRDEILLTAAISGPFTLAARIAQLEAPHSPGTKVLPAAAIEVASAMVTKVCAALVEAGANLLFIREEILPDFTSDMSELWRVSLDPAFNITRFYEASPALLLGSILSSHDYAEYALREFAGTAVCLRPDVWSSFGEEMMAKVDPASVGIAIAPEGLDTNVSVVGGSLSARSWTTPAIITTVGDVPRTTEAKSLAKQLERAALRG